MATDDFFFRARLDGMADPPNQLAVLARRLPWAQIEALLSPLFASNARMGKPRGDVDTFGPTLVVAAGGVCGAGLPCLQILLLVALLCLRLGSQRPLGKPGAEKMRRLSQVRRYGCGRRHRRAELLLAQHVIVRTKSRFA